jgi:SpoVK/Ycf46/Vps4 family AAA+-type ATPase
VFVIATANRIEALPPELLRKGRFDEIFFVDLPSGEERREILDIHLRKRKRDPTRFDLAQLGRLSESFSGAELEQVVVEGLYHAFSDGKDLEQGHLVKAMEETLPLATTMKEEITRQREWAKTRTRPASARSDEAGSVGVASRFA